MMKGTKKAFARAPHKMWGNKSSEDMLVVEWSKDFNTAQEALGLISSEMTKFVSQVRAIFHHEEAMMAMFAELYEPILDENVYKQIQETPKSSMEAVQGFSEMRKRVHHDQIEPILVHLETTFANNCKRAKECMASVEKALTKRDHKKQDFDRYRNSVDKLVNKKDLGDKEQKQLEKLEIELDKSAEIYYQQDAKCKQNIPQVLNVVSEFLNPMAATIYLAELRVVEILKAALYDHALNQGLLTEANGPEEYTEIADQWENRFLTVQPQYEQGIKVLRDGNVVKKTMDLPSKNKLKSFYKHAKSEIGEKFDSQIKFSSKEQGMFRSEQDILANAAAFSPRMSMISQNNNNRPNSSSTSSFSSSTRNNHFIHSSPIASASPTITPPDSVQTRVRALSSSSAQAMSPFAQYHLPESNEYATALFTFLGDAPGDISFKVGDKIKVFDHGDHTDDKWWFGETTDGRLGLFPFNYVTL